PFSLSSTCPRPPPSSSLFPYTTLFRSSARMLRQSTRIDAHDGPAGLARNRLPSCLCAEFMDEPVDCVAADVAPRERARGGGIRIDRKSTRLNSSHLGISYAVFCLKKKK